MRIAGSGFVPHAEKILIPRAEFSGYFDLISDLWGAPPTVVGIFPRSSGLMIGGASGAGAENA